MSEDYLQRILKARVYDVAIESPLEAAPRLSSRLGNRIQFKREDLQPVFSFKLRGAYNKIAHLSPAIAARGVICASAGNHAQGVALAARHRGIPAVVVMPLTTPAIKVQAVSELGGEIVLHGEVYDAAYEHALVIARERHLVFVHPFDDPDVIAGQGTIGMEIVRQTAGELDAVFVPVGGGGLIGGIGSYLKSVSPLTEIVGCWPENSPVLHECLRAGRVIDVPELPTLSESTAGGLEPDSVTLPLCQKVIDTSVFVSEAEIAAAMRLVLENEHWLIEGAAAVAVAAFRKDMRRWDDKRVAIVLCGRNVSPEVTAQVL